MTPNSNSGAANNNKFRMILGTKSGQADEFKKSIAKTVLIRSTKPYRVFRNISTGYQTLNTNNSLVSAHDLVQGGQLPLEMDLRTISISAFFFSRFLSSSSPQL